MVIDKIKYNKDVLAMKKCLTDIKAILDRLEKRRDNRRKILHKLAKENQITI